MTHRHLLPEEIDLLLDDEEGFGVAPLRDHLEQCPECQSRFQALAGVVARLEALPLMSPAPRFSERVMGQVQVFEPWHVALGDSVRRLMPQSTLGRSLVGATGGIVAVAMSLAAVWIGRRADAILFLANLVTERTRGAIASVAAEAASTVLGTGAATAIRDGGTIAMLGAGLALTATIAVVALGVKAVATAGRRRRA